MDTENRYALVNESGEVVSMIIWKGDPYVPPAGYNIVYSPAGDVGDSIDIETGILTKIDRTAV